MSKEMMQSRMKLYQQLRDFFAKREVSEVETSILSRFGTTDEYIDSFKTVADSSMQSSYLQTSPEFAMKRLLVEGYGDIFQICKVFRKEPRASRHHPEFTMLEWYRIGFSMQQLMDEMLELMQSLSPEFASSSPEFVSYHELFQRYKISVFSDSFDQIKQKIIEYVGYTPDLLDDKDEWLDFMMVSVIERTLGVGGFTFLYDYPVSQAALAKTEVDSNGYLVAKRFELYYLGVELANGFCELTDADEQERRFIADQSARAKQGREVIPYDEYLIKSLKKGMPVCSGVALGLDRVLMLLTKASDISDVICFADDWG